MITQDTMKDAQQDVIRELRRELESAKEQHAMELAAISTATFQNTESSVSDRISRDNPYWTVAYDDTCVAINREINLRAQLAAIKESIASDAEETNNLMAAADYARKKMEKELATCVRLDDPVVKGLVNVLYEYHKVLPGDGARHALAAYNARLKEVGCE